MSNLHLLSEHNFAPPWLHLPHSSNTPPLFPTLRAARRRAAVASSRCWLRLSGRPSFPLLRARQARVDATYADKAKWCKLSIQAWSCERNTLGDLLWTLGAQG